MIKYFFLLLFLVCCNRNKSDLQITDADVLSKDSLSNSLPFPTFETPDESAFMGLNLLKGKWNAFKYHGSFRGLKDDKAYSGTSMAFKHSSDNTFSLAMYDFDSKGKISSILDFSHLPSKVGSFVINEEFNLVVYRVIEDDGCVSKCTYQIDEKRLKPSFVKIIGYDSLKQEISFRFRASLKRNAPIVSDLYPDKIIIEDGAARAKVYPCCPVEGF